MSTNKEITIVAKDNESNGEKRSDKYEVDMNDNNGFPHYCPYCCFGAFTEKTYSIHLGTLEHARYTNL